MLGVTGLYFAKTTCEAMKRKLRNCCKNDSVKKLSVETPPEEDGPS